jgi:hypothetical protein
VVLFCIRENWRIRIPGQKGFGRTSKAKFTQSLLEKANCSNQSLIVQYIKYS